MTKYICNHAKEYACKEKCEHNHPHERMFNTLQEPWLCDEWTSCRRWFNNEPFYTEVKCVPLPEPPQYIWEE